MGLRWFQEHQNMLYTHWTRLPSLQPVTALPLSNCRRRRGQQNFLWISQEQLRSQATHRNHVPAILLFMHTNLKHVSVQSTPGLHRKGTDCKPCKSITCYVFMTGDSTSWISLQELASFNHWSLQMLTVSNDLLSRSVLSTVRNSMVSVNLSEATYLLSYLTFLQTKGIFAKAFCTGSLHYNSATGRGRRALAHLRATSRVSYMRPTWLGGLLLLVR